MNGVSREDALKSVNNGWSGLVNRIYDILPEGTIVIRVKEKFAELRVYLDGTSEEFRCEVDKICAESREICEVCGEPGKDQLIGHWWKTLCDDCANKKREERNGNPG